MTATATSFDKLCAWLDGLTERPDVLELRAKLEEFGDCLCEIEDCAKFCDEGYQRNLIRSTDVYNMFLLCWKPGQRSKVHDHAHSVCGFRVMKGVATEIVFETTPCGQMIPVRSNRVPAGEVVSTQDSDTHQVCNVEAADEPLITMHIYSPPLDDYRVFNLEDGTCEQLHGDYVDHR